MKVIVTQLCLPLCDPVDCSRPGSSVHEIPKGKNTGVGCHFLLQGIFATQGSNPALQHCRWSLYHLSHQGCLCALYDRKYISTFYLNKTAARALSSQAAPVVKNPPAIAGDTRDQGSIPGSRRSPGVGNGNPLQYS